MDKQLIDYRKKYWGHNIEFNELNDNGSFNVCGWCTPHIKIGDEFMHSFKKGMGICVFTEVRNCNNPKDMYFGKVGLIRYATDKDLEVLNEQTT